MAFNQEISYQGTTRGITIDGTPGAKFEIYVKQGSNYYNFDTNNFQTLEKILKNKEKYCY